MIRYKLAASLLISLLFLSIPAWCKDPTPLSIVWPESGTPVLRLNFGKLRRSNSVAGQRSYTFEVVAENLWGKRIPKAEFSLHFYDKNQVRIGDGWISISNVDPGEVIKFQSGFQTSGAPESMTIEPQALPNELQGFLPTKEIQITVNSVPQGAELSVDGISEGITPRQIRVAPGQHVLEFRKQGFNIGHFPLELTADDLSGGSVSYELGATAHDTVELRDGSVLTGDVESMSSTEIVMRIGGTLQRLDRNLVKRLSLVPRNPPAP